jgi:hypothetical protein
MQPRMTPLLLAASLLVSVGGLRVVSAQQEPVDSNGGYVVASADRNPVASGAGEDISYGDITTGNGDYTVVGDPNSVVYRSDLAGTIPTRSDTGGWTIPNTSDGMVDRLLAATPAAADPNAIPVDDSAGVPVDGAGDLAAAPVDDSAAAPVDETTAAPVDDSGDVPVDDSAGVPIDDSGAVPVDDSAGVPVDDGTSEQASAPAWSCADYTSWDEAQSAYEAGGGVDGDPSMVAALDPDGNGVACDTVAQ